MVSMTVLPSQKDPGNACLFITRALLYSFGCFSLMSGALLQQRTVHKPVVFERFPDEQKTYTNLPSRFDVPASGVPKLRTLTPEESGYRILFSTIADQASDGLGHSLATFNAEVVTALRLNLTYSHRFASFGSLTSRDPLAIENFFGWGHSEVSRKQLQTDVCNIAPERVDGARALRRMSQKRVCPICEGLRPFRMRKSSTLALASKIRKIQEIPSALTFGGVHGCNLRRGAGKCRPDFENLVRRHSKTLYMMSPHNCDRVPANSDFSISAPWFYWKYWDLHGAHQQGGHISATHRKPQGIEGTAPPHNRNISFPENELAIAVHARRGDFMMNQNKPKRKMTPSTTFAKVIVSLLEEVQRIGGPFSGLPVAVHVYSDGTFKEGMPGGHDVATMSPVYVDVSSTCVFFFSTSMRTISPSVPILELTIPVPIHMFPLQADGSVQGADWWVATLQRLLAESTLHSSKGIQIRVVMHIARPTLPVLHEMASADIFIGSHSGLSRAVVAVISRGCIVLPCPYPYPGARHVCFDDTGPVNRIAFASRWREYIADFREFVK